ncbi:hypothetical protein B0H67DRAFT_302400 [Lasiosphaeris hirsuta]|uniref:Ribonuclease H1 N-terminal domain-containing protein n=1 Tax=Lasiosphaeris hirsuta TaxID=260670 RepID=A0AA40A9V2_9PEZI|nr:hypothetical protein B0H67DRAFT_302400 [Lasiosphaeris hirsuta]
MSSLTTYPLPMEDHMAFYQGKLVLFEPTTKKKIYAVAKGKIPGFYTTWRECEAQISGFSKNCYQAFSTWEKAYDFMNGKEIKPSECIPSCPLFGPMSKLTVEDNSSDSDDDFNGGSSAKSKGKRPARNNFTAKSEGAKSTDGDTPVETQEKNPTRDNAPASKSKQTREPEPAQNSTESDAKGKKGKGKGKGNAGKGPHKHRYNTRSKKAIEQMPTMQVNVQVVS